MEPPGHVPSVPSPKSGTAKILYQHTKYNNARKQIAKKSYGAN